jgi:RimJ/RimL family protein N-acetyltransferase
MPASQLTIRILHAGDEANLERFLQPHLETSLFLLSNMRQAGLIDSGQPFQGTYAAAFEGEAISGVVALFWNGSLIYQAPSYLPALQEAVQIASGRPLRTLLGPAAQVQAGLEALGAAVQVWMDDPQVLFGLSLVDLVVPEPLHTGAVRARLLHADDLPLLVRWRVASRIESFLEPDTPDLWEEAQAGVERYLVSQRQWVLEAGGVPVSTCTLNAEIREVVQVGGVYTPPEARGRGYARAVVAAALRDVRAEGVQTGILFTDDNNLSAQKAYQAIGFRPIGDYRIVLVHQP